MQHLIRTARTAAFGLVLMLTVLMPSAAGAAGYIKIAGVEGESTARGHKNEIEILSWSWGDSPPAVAMKATSPAATSATDASPAARSAASPAGADSSPVTTGAKRQHSIITITKQLDRSSPMLQKANADHQVFPSMTLSLPNPDGASNTYLVYELKEVIVSSYQTGASGGGDMPTESVSLNYAKIKEIKKPATESKDKALDQN